MAVDAEDAWKLPRMAVSIMLPGAVPKSSGFFRSLLRSLYLALGIIVTIGIYSFLQERMVSQPYDGEIFKATMFLVLCNRIFSVLYSLLMLWRAGESWGTQAPPWKYAAVSFSNMLSTWCQYESLRHVSLVLQTMAKTFKMLPTMLMGVIVSKKRHSMKDILTVVLITTGIMIFAVGGDIKSEHASASSWYGILLLTGFLVFDGFTSTFQEKLFTECRMSKYNQMLYMNLTSASVAVASLLVTDSTWYCFRFLKDHKYFAPDVVALSFSATAGQFYIFSMIQEFGALALAAAMNARQITTIIASYAFRPQSATWTQSIGLALLFLGLILRSVWNWRNIRIREDKTSPSCGGSSPESDKQLGNLGVVRAAKIGHTDVEEVNADVETEEFLQSR